MTAAHNPSTSRIEFESDAALNPSRLEKKVHPQCSRVVDDVANTQTKQTKDVVSWCEHTRLAE